MAIVRRRYYLWLLKAYIKRWYKAILSSILLGGVIFFAIVAVVNFYFLPRIQKRVQKIGYVGVYTFAKIPTEILSDVSYGLTRIDENGKISPGAAFKWDVKNNGKQYTFYIRRGQYLHNKRELDAKTIPLIFKDVEKKIDDKYTLTFTLKSPYAPFLTSLSRPIILQSLAGLGKMKIKDVDINGGYVRTLTLENKNDSTEKKIITFYPTQDALKSSFALGDIDEARHVQNTKIKNSDFSKWNNTKITILTDYTNLVTLFYNTEDKLLSEKRLRQALSYSIPDDFTGGERAYSPIPPNSQYFSQTPNYGISDLELARSLISENTDIKKSTIEITTTDEYVKTAETIAKSWKELGISTKIKIVNELPTKFQALIYPIALPDDPDQYTLWHSNQFNNITRYKNLRIDKLLEDGRSINDIEQRISIYSDFQKYLIDDAPATFLYFPKNFTITRI